MLVQQRMCKLEDVRDIQDSAFAGTFSLTVELEVQVNYV